MEEQNLDEDTRHEIRSRFGLLVREKRLALGWSQEELAFQAGLHRTYIGHVERAERNLSLESIFVLAYALKCHPRELIPDLPSINTHQKHQIKKRGLRKF